MADYGVTTPNEIYTLTAKAVKEVRDSLDGEVVVKAQENIGIHLPDPYPHLTEADGKAERIKRYRAGAEFDEIPGNTAESLVGAMFRTPLTFEAMPAQLEYLIDDADGDGVGLEELLKMVALEQLGFNYVGGLAEFSDLASMDLDQTELTKAKAQELGLRSFIKLYPREAVIDWNFRRVNNVKQLDYIVLKETEAVRDSAAHFREKTVDSYLQLYLDEEGYYTQRRYTKKDGAADAWTEPHQPTQRGDRLRYIPFEFAIAAPSLRDDLPKKLGYLAGIVSKTLHRFRASADYKECLWLNGAPMTSSSGWDETAHDIYYRVTGLKHVPTGPGAHFMRPPGVEYEIHSWEAGQSAYADYMNRNEREIRALGGRYDTTDGDPETATAAAINHAEKTGALSAVAGSTEAFINKLLIYCGGYMGIDTPPDIVKLSREFTQTRITPQERRAILDELDSGIIDEAEALAQLKRGGALVAEVDDVLTRLNNNQNGGE